MTRKDEKRQARKTKGLDQGSVMPGSPARGQSPSGPIPRHPYALLGPTRSSSLVLVPTPPLSPPTAASITPPATSSPTTNLPNELLADIILQSSLTSGLDAEQGGFCATPVIPHHPYALSGSTTSSSLMLVSTPPLPPPSAPSITPPATSSPITNLPNELLADIILQSSLTSGLDAEQGGLYATPVIDWQTHGNIRRICTLWKAVADRPYGLLHPQSAHLVIHKLDISDSGESPSLLRYAQLLKLDKTGPGRNALHALHLSLVQDAVLEPGAVHNFFDLLGIFSTTFSISNDRTPIPRRFAFPNLPNLKALATRNIDLHTSWHAPEAISVHRLIQRLSRYEELQQLVLDQLPPLPSATTTTIPISFYKLVVLCLTNLDERTFRGLLENMALPNVTSLNLGGVPDLSSDAFNIPSTSFERLSSLTWSSQRLNITQGTAVLLMLLGRVKETLEVLSLTNVNLIPLPSDRWRSVDILDELTAHSHYLLCYPVLGGLHLKECTFEWVMLKDFIMSRAWSLAMKTGLETVSIRSCTGCARFPKFDGERVFHMGHMVRILELCCPNIVVDPLPITAGVRPDPALQRQFKGRNVIRKAKVSVETRKVHNVRFKAQDT